MTWAQIDDVAVISIHALHEESDLAVEERRGRPQISIHALHEESDACTSATV